MKVLSGGRFQCKTSVFHRTRAPLAPVLTEYPWTYDMHSFSESSCHVLDTLKYMNHIFVSLWQFQHLQVKKYPEFDCSGRSRVRVRARAPFFFAFFFSCEQVQISLRAFFSFFGNLVFFFTHRFLLHPSFRKAFIWPLLDVNDHSWWCRLSKRRFSLIARTTYSWFGYLVLMTREVFLHCWQDVFRGSFLFRR